MSNYSAQGSITIKRLRNGDSIFLTLDLNGKPLYQAYDEQTGTVSPDWTVDGNRPVITPHATSTRGNTVSLSDHSWTYNGVVLIFNGATSGSYVMDSTGKFGMNITTGALKIFANLASAVNIASDTLLYGCIATVTGTEYALSKSCDIQIVVGGASSYYGFIKASTTQLDEAHSSATLATELWLSTTGVASYYVKWYKGTTEWTDKAGAKSIIVDRSDIDGAQLFIAEFYANQGDASYVYRAGITILDTLDEIVLVPYISSQNKEVDAGSPVTVAARLIRTSTNAVLTPVNPSWLFTIMDGDTWTSKGSSTAASIEVNTSHTDQPDGTYHDVEVIVDCTFDSVS